MCFPNGQCFGVPYICCILCGLRCVRYNFCSIISVLVIPQNIFCLIAIDCTDLLMFLSVHKLVLLLMQDCLLLRC